jgi:uncharacterized protein with ParB-like and HNH nuclease domain/predicted transport protein
MKASEAKLIDLLRKAPQFVIPIYQRTYSWAEKECRQLWDDVVRTGADDGIAVHFIGSIVYIEQGLVPTTLLSPLLVIDGQQRLTTVMLLIAALARALGETEPVDGFSQRKLRNIYLLNPEETGERHYKLLLSQTDKASLMAIVGSAEPPKQQSLRVTENFQLFKDLIASCNGEFAAVCKGLAKLVVVDVALNRGQDNPQLIFESMNSTGRELTQADLIRNYILMGLEPALQTRLYEDYWRPMEVAFGQEAYGTHFDGFMRYYLTVKMKTGEPPNVRRVYEAFKTHAQLPRVGEAGAEALVRDIRNFAGYFCAIALNAETNPDLSLAFHDLRELKVDPAYPFLLELYHDYKTGSLPVSDFVLAVRFVEAYVFRRAICAIPPNSLSRIFANFTKVLRKDRYLESIQAHIIGLQSQQRFPDDDEFRRDIQTRDLYNFRSRSYWLRRMENHGRKERVEVEKYTIEHILPQSENLSAKWREALGPDWKRVQKDLLHTLGNLTLTGYNSEYSDRSFLEKRDMTDNGKPMGFKNSPLVLNEGLGVLEQWTEDAIKGRAKKLAELAVQVWKSPSLPPEVIAMYRPAATNVVGATVEDYPPLINSPFRELFCALRKEIIALDPCVAEEFLKNYVAYKAETNFVDVKVQVKGLRLALNMAFTDINDPEKRCEDKSAVGHWGNGDVEVGLVSLGEIPYMMGLIRQSFEKQLASEADE